MYGQNLRRIFEEIREVGVVESAAAFSRWVGRSPDYIRDHQRLGGYGRVHPNTVAHLRAKLVKISQEVPPGIAQKIEAVIALLDRDVRVMASLARYDGSPRADVR